MNRQTLNRWYNIDQLEQQAQPDIVRQWLGAVGSMTHAMRSLTEEQLQLQLLSSAPQQVHSEEAELLGALTSIELFTREVLMQQEEEALLYGRSIFPASLADVDLATIENLGTEPLGEVLFKLKEAPRLSMQFAMLDKNNYLYQALNQHLIQSEPLFARRSLFDYQGQHVLVQEVFLTPHPIYALVNCD